MRRRSNSDYFGPTTGFMGFLHRVVMILLYPFRKPLIFIPVLILMYLIPTFIGSKPSEVHLWYWNKIKSGYAYVSEIVLGKVSPLIDKTENLVPDVVKSSLQERGIDQLVGTKQKVVRRQMFEKAKAAPQAVDILESEEVVSVEEGKREQTLALVAKQEAEAQTLQQAKPQAEIQHIEISKTLPLIYLDNPTEISGEAQVQNANEMVVNGTYLFLYGIYVEPNSVEGLNAQKYLEQYVKDKIVRCSIVAYTYQEVATALCYVDGKNINRHLIDEGYSKNVAL